MSQEFLHTILKEDIIDILPPRIQSFLLPTHRKLKRIPSQDTELFLQDKARSEAGSGNPNEGGVLATDAVLEDKNNGSRDFYTKWKWPFYQSCRASPDTHKWIVQVLYEKKQEKESRI